MHMQMGDFHRHPLQPSLQVYIRDISLHEREETNHTVDWHKHMVTLLPERGVVYNISVSGVNDKGEGIRSTPIPLTIPGGCAIII